MICKGKTKKGLKCKNKCKRKYCHLHCKKSGGGTSKFKLNPKASEWVPSKPPKISKTKPKISKTKPKLTLKPDKKGVKFCPDYQEVCKKSKYGDLYRYGCRLEERYIDNLGRREKAKKCLKLRIEHANCRIKKGFKSTPRHEHAIKKIYKNIGTCKNIMNKQKQMIQFQKLKLKEARKVKSEPKKR